MKNSCKIIPEPGTGATLQKIARENMKLLLMLDLRADIAICRIEGWDYKEYLLDLKELIDGFLREDER